MSPPANANEAPDSVEAKGTPKKNRFALVTSFTVVVVVIGGILVMRQAAVKPSLRTDAKWVSGSAAGFNVLLISLDTTRADHLGSYGYASAETPVMDRLAAEGTMYADAITPAPATLPSHATILTGLDPPGHGVRYNGEYSLAAEHVTLAEILKDAGYQTAAFVSVFVLDGRFGLSQGFDRYDCDLGVAPSADKITIAHERLAEMTTSAAIDWLESRDSDRPFFAWLHYFSPHGPYEPPPDFAKRFPDKPYDGEIAYMDSEIGRFLDAVRKDGALEKTLILVVGDHGEGFGEHDELAHGFLVYESVMRIPLIMSCPAIFTGPQVVDNTVVSTTDIFPTVLDLLGIENKLSIDGMSLLSAAQQTDRRVYMESFAPYLEFGWAPLFALRRHADKYILAPSSEYYDLRSDPDELSNLYGLNGSGSTGPWQSLDTDLKARLKKQGSIEAVAASARKLDAKFAKALAGMGYIGSASGPADDVLRNPMRMMPIKRAVDEGTGLISAGRYAEALNIGQRALRESPQSRRLQNMMASLYLKLNRIDEAEAALRKSLNLNPRSDAYHNLCQILLKQRRWDEVAELLDQAEKLNPNHGAIWISKGDYMARRGRGDQAIECYEHAKEIDPYRSTSMADARIKRVRERMAELSRDR